MWYRDIANVNETAAVSSTVDYFDCSEETARNIVTAAARFNEYGSRGKWPFDPCDQHTAMREAFAIYASHERFGGLDKHDVGDLFLDAWEEGIQRKDRVVVSLNSHTDASCGQCGACLAHVAERCTHCGSRDIVRFVMAEVCDPWASTWAEADKYIDGSTWETLDDGLVYTKLVDRPGLVDELRAEGYRLDLSAYEGGEA